MADAIRNQDSLTHGDGLFNWIDKTTRVVYIMVFCFRDHSRKQSSNNNGEFLACVSLSLCAIVVFRAKVTVASPAGHILKDVRRYQKVYDYGGMGWGGVVMNAMRYQNL